MTTIENEYYLRTTLLIMKGGVFATRKVLNREVGSNGGDLNVLLLSHRPILKHEFHKKQFDKLFPLGGETVINMWDIAMLTGVLVIVFKPTLCDEDRNAIRAIKSNRNEVSAHNPTASLSIDTFEYCRDELDKAITQLCSTFDDTIKKECKDIINNCLNGPLEIKSCLESMKKSWDTDDLFCAIMSKFDSTGERLSDEITSAKRDICQVVHDEQEKQTSEIRKMVIETVRKAFHEGRLMKTVKVVDSEITVGGSTEKWIDLCEKIIVDITNKAVKKIGGSTDFAEIEKAVFDLLDEINSHDDVEVQGARNGSIILRVSFSTYKGLLDALLCIECPVIQQKLDALAVSLQSHFGMEEHPRISLQISDDQLKALLGELREDIETKHKTFRIPLRCSSFGGLEHVWNLFEGYGSKALEKLAVAISSHLGTTITLTSAVNVDMFLNAIEDEGITERVDTGDEMFANAVKNFLHMTGPILFSSLLYQHKLLPKLAFNSIIDSVNVNISNQKEQIFDDLSRILLNRLRHRFRRVPKQLFLLVFLKIYVHYTRMPMTVPKMELELSYNHFRSTIVQRLKESEVITYEYLLKTTLATEAITEDDLNKKFICITLLQDYYGFKFDQKHSLLAEMCELVNKTGNPLVSEIMLLSRIAVNLYKSGKLTESKIRLHDAMCKASLVNPCYEVIDMHYMHAFLSHLQYEQLPSTESREAVLLSGRIGLEMLADTNENHYVYELWRYMFKLRMVFVLLQLGSNGYLLQSNETVIDKASIVEAEYLLQDIARMDSFDHLFERKHSYYFALVRLFILKSNYQMATFYTESVLNELENFENSSLKTDQAILVAKSYLKDIQDELKVSDSVLENKNDTRVNNTEDTPCSTSETSDHLSVLHENVQALEINDLELKQIESVDTQTDFSNQDKVISDLRQLFDCFFNERSTQGLQRNKSRKKKQKTKRKQRELLDYIEKPSLE